LPRSIALREAERERRAFLDLPNEPLRVTIETVGISASITKPACNDF